MQQIRNWLAINTHGSMSLEWLRCSIFWLNVKWKRFGFGCMDQDWIRNGPLNQQALGQFHLKWNDMNEKQQQQKIQGLLQTLYRQQTVIKVKAKTKTKRTKRKKIFCEHWTVLRRLYLLKMTSDSLFDNESCKWQGDIFGKSAANYLQFLSFQFCCYRLKRLSFPAKPKSIANPLYCRSSPTPSLFAAQCSPNN